MKKMVLPVLIATVLLVLVGCGKKEKEPEGEVVPEEKAPVEEVAPVDTGVVGEEEGFPPAIVPEETLKTVEEVKPYTEVPTYSRGTGFTVQVSAWRSRGNAEQDAQRFREQGYEAYVQRAFITEKGEVWYRVRIGSFSTISRAEAFAQELTELLEAGFWVDNFREGG